MAALSDPFIRSQLHNCTTLVSLLPALQQNVFTYRIARRHRQERVFLVHSIEMVGALRCKFRHHEQHFLC